MNQFFAGIGGEDKADTAVGWFDGPIGPGKRLQSLLGSQAEISATVYCGDNYFNEHTSQALASVVQIARDQKADLLVAGPAFAAGRYGFACAEVCYAFATSLSGYAVTAMSQENPGVERYKQYRDKKVFLYPTAETTAGMSEALLKVSRAINKLAAGGLMGPAAEEGYIARGIRTIEPASQTAAERAFDMLLSRLLGKPFVTEIPVESLAPVPVAPPVTNMATARLALVSTSGVVPRGNPDGFKMHRNTQWRKYSIEKLNSMQDTSWDAIHGGYFTGYMKQNPNLSVPLDVCREMEAAGVFAQINSYFYATSGINALISAMQKIGEEMVADMKSQGITAALLAST